MNKPYKAKTIKGAERRVRSLHGQLRYMAKVARDAMVRESSLKLQLKALARLSAKGPAFNSPLEAFAAEEIRDKVLREMGMNPDGTYIGKDSK